MSTTGSGQTTDAIKPTGGPVTPSSATRPWHLDAATVLRHAALGAALAAFLLVEGLGAHGALDGQRLAIHTAFLGALGLVSRYTNRRLRGEHEALREQAAAASGRLAALEAEVDATRTLGRLGERTARVAHGFKSTLHSLRGFAALAESPHTSAEVRKEALAGLRQAIDSIEAMAREALAPACDGRSEPATGSTADVGRAVDDVIAEVARDHTGVRWVRPPRALPKVAIPSAQLREVLAIVARNAAEATGDSGVVVMSAEVGGGDVRLVVQDDGPGVDPRLKHRLFTPGTTTKPSGSGYGLFLARRIVRSRGGDLTVDRAARGGATVSVRLPALPS